MIRALCLQCLHEAPPDATACPSCGSTDLSLGEITECLSPQVEASWLELVRSLSAPSPAPVSEGQGEKRAA
jgi:hypothetical protein